MVLDRGIWKVALMQLSCFILTGLISIPPIDFLNPTLQGNLTSFLGFHTDKTFRNDLFSVERYDDLGLGLKSKVRIPVDDFAEECPGYLELIGEDLFDALHHLGYNSLFTYLDKHNERQFCILYGPLSLINNADEFCEVGFTWRGPDADEWLHLERSRRR
jgi:hypothetical protein